MAILDGSIQLAGVTSAFAASSTDVLADDQVVLVLLPSGLFRLYRGDGSTQLQTLYATQKYLPTNDAILTLLSAYLETAQMDTDPTLAAQSNALVPSQLAIKTYVDNILEGVDVKEHVRLATTANITLSGTQTIDGAAGAVDDRILVKDQTTGTENGIYLMKSGAWVRTLDADSATDLLMAGVQVLRGSVNGSTKWRLLTNPITLGVTNLVWQADVGGTYSADESTLTLVGSQFSAKDDGITVAKLQAVILKAIGALTPAANKGVYFTSGSAAALFDLDSFTRGILNASDAVSWLRNIKALYNNWVAVSADSTLIASDAGKVHDVTTSSATITITLPSAAGVAAGTTMVVRKANSDAYTVVTSPATETLRMGGDRMVLVSDATNWKVVQHTTSHDAFARKSADQNSTSTSLADVTDLSLPMLANTDYEVEAIVLHTRAASTSGIWISVNGPASPTKVIAHINTSTSATAVVFAQVTAYDGGAATTSMGLNGQTIVKGIIRNGANAGNLVVRFASEDGGQVTAQTGSYLKLRRMN